MASLETSPGPFTNGTPNGNGAHANGDEAAFDTAPVRAYLGALLPALLGAAPDDLDGLYEDEFEERVARFAAEGTAVMYVTKIKHDLGGAPVPRVYARVAAVLTTPGRRRLTSDTHVPPRVASDVLADAGHDCRAYQAHTGARRDRAAVHAGPRPQSLRRRRHAV
jgi:hypothetical protein